MVRLNAIASGIFGLLVTSAPVSATDFTELSLFFASSATIQADGMQVSTNAPTLQDNAVLSPEDVFKVASISSSTSQPGGLFRNTELVVNIHSASDDIAHTEVLHHCTSLDLVNDSSMFGLSAECDRQRFSYSVNGHTIVILKNDKIFREYELETGNYMINGYPVIFN
ncbi:hypothetical protein PZ897_03220 [Hoeflea sp. YIM 152468]|uniref:hypothetical protein n=1 Tax=Hoeflea sp. YIM 152468 TaxID=3031759 RepID=UPI0023DBAB89|nr:hypothetical protein [Hoeflea sp. YIM 152468]MDF1607180.1 hypothetical protein [Hoeflea sp. YIM 152468]